MLPQIEWWGGLLLIWGAICYVVMVKNYTIHWSVDALSTHAVFFAATLLVLGWFHPLQTVVLKQAYLGVFGVMVLALPLIFFWPGSDDGEPEPPAKGDADEEELSPLFSFLGQAIFLGPLFVAAALGAFKSYQLARSIGLLA